MDFKPSKIGKYLLLERIAMGGMAEVYRAKASGAGGFEKQLAIKRILPNYSSNEEFRRMFEYEARLSSMLTHSNIVQIYDFVKSGETYLLAMEYVNGKNLRQFINKIKKIGFSLPVEFGVSIICEVCKGLEYAHTKKDDLSGRTLNIIHRDMSPQNVMLSYEGAIKIVDFGIAKAKDRVDETRSGVIKGKFGYMSPEQANGEEVDHRTDIFSTTIILYELLTSKRLFAADNDMATLKMIQECVVPPPSRSNPKVTAELEKIVMKGLTKDMSLRFQNAGDMHRSLQAFLNKYYPSYTQRDLSDALHRVFREEITTEKKRFEQIYRQSIPFSQGAKIDDEGGGEEEEASLASQGIESSASVAPLKESDDATRSELVEQTNPTGDGLGDEPLSVASQASKTSQASQASQVPSQVSQKFKPLPDLTGSRPVRTDATGDANSMDHTAIENLVDDAPSASTMGRKTFARAERQAPELDDEKSGEKTLIDNTNDPFSQAATPTIGTPTVGTPTEARARTRVAPPKPPEKKISSSGLSLEDPTAQAGGRRRERSISHIGELSSDSPDAEPIEETPAPVQPRDEPSLNVMPSTGLPRSQHIQIDDHRQRYDEERSSFSLVTVIRAVLTAGFLVGVLLGTFQVWRIYLAGGLPKVMSDIIAKYGGERPVSDTKRMPTDERAPQAVDPAKPVTECTLSIDSDPRVATILIDGAMRGTTPATVPLECKHDYDVTIRQEGYEDISENIFARGSSQKLYKTLKKIPMGSIKLIVSPGVLVEVVGTRFSQYVKAGDSVTIPLRANVPQRIHFSSEILGIDVTREFKITESAREEVNVNLTPDNRR